MANVVGIIVRNALLSTNTIRLTIVHKIQKQNDIIMMTTIPNGNESAKYRKINGNEDL